MTVFSHIFEPGSIGTLRVKNRIMMPALATNFTSDQGGVTERLVDFCAERARGGAGVVVVENANVDFPEGTNGATQLRIDEDRFIPGLSYLAQSVQRAGARVFQQINHGGPASKSAKLGGLRCVGPSAVAWPPVGEVPRPLEKAEIERIAGKFASAAARVKKAGFDGVEVHGAGSYLLSSFISPFSNKRADEYGGSPANRMRFPLTVVRRIRDAVGPDFPISFRFAADEFFPGGLELNEGVVVATMLDSAGVDLISLISGSRSSLTKAVEPMSYPEGWRVYLAATVKARVSAPVVTSGNIKMPQMAEKILAEKQADFVALARPLIADPYWVEKAFAGKPETINRCISCNIGCMERRVFKDMPIACSINPRVGWEGKPVMSPGPRRKVLVIGGGPAGMEATWRLRERGHDVLLVEKESRLGGQLWPATAVESKAKLKWYADSLRERMARSGAEVRLGTSADSALIREYGPDVVILATGSVAAQPFASSEKIVTARDVLAAGTPLPGRKVVVVGGGSVGCECAEYLAEAGNDVTVLEMADTLAADMDVVSRDDILERLGKLKVKTVTDCSVRSLDTTGVDCERGGRAERVEADLIIVAVGARSDVSLEQAIREAKVASYYVVGDANRPGKLIDAVHQAASIAESL